MEVSIFEYFQPFSGSFKGKQNCSDYPPSELFGNNMSCKPFANFVRSTLLDHLTSGAIFLKGKVGQVDPPHLVLPLTVELTKPRLCHDARFFFKSMDEGHTFQIRYPFGFTKICGP